MKEILTKRFQESFVELCTYPILKKGSENRRVEIGIMIPYQYQKKFTLSNETKKALEKEMRINFKNDCLYKFYKENIENK